MEIHTRTLLMNKAVQSSRIHIYLVTWTELIHGTYLSLIESLTKHIERRHLSAEHRVDIHITCSTNVTLVERLRKKSQNYTGKSQLTETLPKLFCKSFTRWSRVRRFYIHQCVQKVHNFSITSDRV